MNASAIARVRRRAGDQCEYCRVRQADRRTTLEIDHVVARQHRGGDDAANLALACARCNRRKGTNLSGIDPTTGAIVALFNPRRDRWREHFRFDEGHILGLTDVGRCTVATLHLNDHVEVMLRARLQRLGKLD